MLTYSKSLQYGAKRGKRQRAQEERGKVRRKASGKCAQRKRRADTGAREGRGRKQEWGKMERREASFAKLSRICRI